MVTLFWTVATITGLFSIYLLWTTFRRRVVLEHDGKGRVTLRHSKLLPDTERFAAVDVAKLSFGVRENLRTQNAANQESGWFWHVDVVHRPTNSPRNGKPAIDGQTVARMAREFVVAVQQEPPNRERAVVPPQVKDLVRWFETSTGHRARGPILSSRTAWQPEQS